MKTITEISIDDEVAVSFSYTSESLLTVGFSGYFDLIENRYQEKSCLLIIERWTSASAQVDVTNEAKKQALEKELGIISMIFSLELTNSLLKAYVLTLDNRYLMLEFENATVGYIFPETS